MAVQAMDNKGFDLILQSFKEEFNFSNSFYENQIKGNVLAYRLAHFGYMPLNSYKILIAIGINLLILYLIFKLINYFYRK